jgi:DNA invertase Pin-like site-specific DNA recombinase
MEAGTRVVGYPRVSTTDQKLQIADRAEAALIARTAGRGNEHADR